ncbi:hypothetical protein BKA65DRAFT_599966 [Rhexocercosporidium sp. MPI-PUGE-AT-0058]|nr:hypothetical protein BKA65DRAFT_599966 [Rhexocercosporidium sp. MPI-PUGE-AT-0058]
MASPIQQTSTFTGGPPPESSVRASIVVEPAAENTVDASAAAVAALQDLARGLSPSEEISFTVEPDSISCAGEKIQITQLKGMWAIFSGVLRTSSKGYSTLQRDVFELLLPMIDGIVAQEEMQECINSLQKENGGLQQKIRRLLADIGVMQENINQLQTENRDLDYWKRDMERTAIRLEQMNYELRKEKERFEAERKAGTDEGAESLTESDGEGPGRKRKRGEN